MKRSILVVDDDALIRELTDVALSQAGYHVVTASSGQTALGVLSQVRIDLVLLDIHMPGMDGLAVLDAAGRRHGARIPIVMMTADSGEDKVREARRMGCAGYVVKPFTPQSPCARVQACLDAPRPTHTRWVA